MSVIAESVYDEVARIVESSSFRRESLQLVTTQFPQIRHESLLSIHSQLLRLYTKRTFGQHNRPKTKLQYYHRYLSARDEGSCSVDLLLQLAEEVCLSPALYARIILEQFAETTPSTSSSHTSGTPTPSPANTTTVAPQTTEATISSPTLAVTTPTLAVTSPTLAVTTPTVSISALVNQWMKNPLSIPDHHLQPHIKTCIMQDINYGPLGENMKRSVGYEYELLLKERVQKLQIPFLDEEGLRVRGYDKTPDIKLEVPLAVNGHVVNWIESKASFGDRINHEKYMEDQLWPYQNRYGSGLVIYWLGYVAELNSLQDQGILLMERFPDTSQITTLHTSLSPPLTGTPPPPHSP